MLLFTSFLHITPSSSGRHTSVYILVQCCGVTVKAFCDLYLAKLLWKIITEEEKASESPAATEHSSVAPPVSVKGSFALDERLSLSLSLCLPSEH